MVPSVATVDELGAHLTGREVASPDGVAYAVAGDIDISATGALEDRLLAFGAANAYVVRLDMADVEFLDSSGLAVLLRARGLLGREDRALAVILPPGPAKRTFDVSGFGDMFATYISREEAAAAVVPANPDHVE